MASKAITDKEIKNEPTREPNPDNMHHRQTHYQLNYCRELKDGFLYETYEVTLENVENKIVYYEETVGC
jgi:hypothetical protein